MENIGDQRKSRRYICNLKKKQQGTREEGEAECPSLFNRPLIQLVRFESYFLQQQLLHWSL
jgi:hypothetical protein